MKRNPKTVKAMFSSAEDGDEFTAMVKSTVEEWAEQKHPKTSWEERKMLNSLPPGPCPRCGWPHPIRWGKTRDGIARYRCPLCGRTFGPLTGTLFDSHKIPASEWVEYLVNLVEYESVRQSGLTNMNSISTGRYWSIKLFEALDGVQDGIVLFGDVYVDETYFKVVPSGLTIVSGRRLRGISRDCVCVATAVSRDGFVLIHCGNGKPSGQRILEALGSHIARGSRLIHDGENSHRALVVALGLDEEVHPTSETDGLPDSLNPLDPVNELHGFLKKFMSRHGAFDREYMQGWLDLFHEVHSCFGDAHAFVERVLRRVISCRKVLRYRDVMSKKRGRIKASTNTVQI